MIATERLTLVSATVELARAFDSERHGGSFF